MTLIWRTQPSLQRPLFFSIRKFQHSTSVVAVLASPSKESKELELPKTGLQGGNYLPLTSLQKEKSTDGDRKVHEWKKFDSTQLGITNSMISKPARVVLNALKKKGYEVYLVGGCVRDLVLKRIPKDFDIITSAKLMEVRKAFKRCIIVGKRFPICHVRIDDTIIEVSSFSTSARKAGERFNCGLKRPPGCSDKDYIRWRNCMERDFTINGMMFDPYAKIVYDYLGGMRDIKKTKVRTIKEANLSFMEDSARILRAIRFSARLGFHLTREVFDSLEQLTTSLQKLDKGRILLEVNYLLAYGSAEASLRLLWRFGLLEILLPIQASYFASHGFQRRDERSNMLLSLFSNLDKLVSPDCSCHASLWLGIFAFHKALFDQPRDPQVVAAFALAVHSGGSLSKSVKLARRISQSFNESFCELKAQDIISNDEMTDEVVNLASSVKTAISKMANGRYVSQAMAKYPQVPPSDMVFISMDLRLRVQRIFSCVRRDEDIGMIPKAGTRIDYESLSEGNLQEVRRVFARIVFDTVYPLKMQSSEKNIVEANNS